jgi:hypothetical protein
MTNVTMVTEDTVNIFFPIQIFAFTMSVIIRMISAFEAADNNPVSLLPIV